MQLVTFKERHQPVSLGCSCVAKPKYFTNNIASINLWFNVCGRKYSANSTDSNTLFTGDGEIYYESRIPRGILQFTISKHSASFFLDLCQMRSPALLCPHMCIVSLLKMQALLRATYFLILSTALEADVLIIPILQQREMKLREAKTLSSGHLPQLLGVRIRSQAA